MLLILQNSFLRRTQFRRPDGSVGTALVLPALTDCRWWFESLLAHSGVSSATRRKATGADQKKTKKNPPTDPILGLENFVKTGFAQKGLPSMSTNALILYFFTPDATQRSRPNRHKQEKYKHKKKKPKPASGELPGSPRWIKNWTWPHKASCSPRVRCQRKSRMREPLRGYGCCTLCALTSWLLANLDLPLFWQCYVSKVFLVQEKVHSNMDPNTYAVRRWAETEGLFLCKESGTSFVDLLQ